MSSLAFVKQLIRSIQIVFCVRFSVMVTGMKSRTATLIIKFGCGINVKPMQTLWFLQSELTDLRFDEGQN